MQAVFIDMPPVSAAVPAFSQGNAARPGFRLIKFDELRFLDGLRVELLEHFSMITCCHFTSTPNSF